jgi:UDP-N-acetylglucosamine:LPS N-acetylglucosamine transferase
MSLEPKQRKVLAVASGGGHWVQLLRLRQAFAHCDVIFVTVSEAYRADVAGHKFYSIPDATRHTWIAMVRTAWNLSRIIYKEKPDVVISTGAAPGFVAVSLGKLVGAKTIWLDSIANIERLSMSGALARRHADLWLTQWPHLAKQNGPRFRGAVL